MQNKKILPERIKDLMYTDSHKIITLFIVVSIYAQLKGLSRA